MKKLVIVIILLVGAGAAVWTFTQKADTTPEAGDFRGGAPGAVPITVAAVTTMPFEDRVEAIGTTKANETVVITAKVTDKISQIHFADGEFVEKGALLVELTNDEQAAQLSEAKADRDEARTQLKRIEDLAKQGTVAASQADETRARYSVTNARLEGIVARLKDRVIRAPFAGVLGFRQVSPGTLVSPGTAITTLDDVSTLKLDFNVPELFLGAIDVGDPVAASSPAYREKEFQGTVAVINSRVDEVTRSVTVRALLPNASGDLRPGMLMTVLLKTASRNALAVPEAAVIPSEKDAYVYVISSDNIAQRREIKTGQRSDGRVEVLSGLDEGERIAVLGLVKLRDGATVRVAGQEGG